MCRRSSKPISNVVVWNTALYDSAVGLVMKSTWLLLAASVVVFVQAAEHGAWQKAPLYWLKMFYPISRYHGVFAPNSRHRIHVSPSGRGKGQARSELVTNEPPLTHRRAAMTWAQRLRRVFNIDIETCHYCGGAMKVIACIEEQAVINRILAHLQLKEASVSSECPRPEQRGPPVHDLFE